MTISAKIISIDNDYVCLEQTDNDCKRRYMNIISPKIFYIQTMYFMNHSSIIYQQNESEIFRNETNYVIYEVTGDKIYKVLTTCDILVLNLLNNFYINLLSYFIELNYPTSSFVYDDPVYDIAYDFCETNNINKAYYLREYHCSLLVDDNYKLSNL